AALTDRVEMPPRRRQLPAMEEQQVRHGRLRSIDVDPMADRVVIGHREEIERARRAGGCKIANRQRTCVSAGVDAVAVAVSRMHVQVAAEPSRAGANDWPRAVQPFTNPDPPPKPVSP